MMLYNISYWPKMMHPTTTEIDTCFYCYVCYVALLVWFTTAEIELSVCRLKLMQRAGGSVAFPTPEDVTGERGRLAGIDTITTIIMLIVFCYYQYYNVVVLLLLQLYLQLLLGCTFRFPPRSITSRLRLRLKVAGMTMRRK